LSFESLQKISLVLVTGGLFAYASVSPRTLPLTEYNLQFYENVRIACLSLIAPAVYMLSVLDARENDINSVVNSFFVAFTLGYVGTMIIEIVVTTILRLAAFCLFEPEVFSLTPKVPIPILPWVLRENQYRPKRITLFAADFGTSCVACPIIEECVKLCLLRWTASLPRCVSPVYAHGSNSGETKQLFHSRSQKLSLGNKVLDEEKEEATSCRDCHSQTWRARLR
jgi:hypothetical protein